MLFETLESLTYEHFSPQGRIDAQKRFRLDLDPAFPFTVLPFTFEGSAFPHPLNCHRALEIFVPAEGRGRFQMGDKVVDFSRGDVVVVDNAKLHGLLEFEGGRRRGVAIVFAPEFVYRPWSPLADLAFLAPFQGSLPDPVRLQARRTRECEMAVALSKLLSSWTDSVRSSKPGIGCKVYLLELLYLLSQRMRPSYNPADEFARRQKDQEFLWRFHDHFSGRIAERLSVADAADFARMGRFAFMRYFRRVTGVTFVAYLMQLRLEKATRLLVETDDPIGSVAAAAGFCDQSYMDRVFRKHYGRAPRALRRR